METIIKFPKNADNYWVKISIELLVSLIFLISTSCKKEVNNFFNNESLKLKSHDIVLKTELVNNSSIYYQHKIFKRAFGEPIVETQKIKNSNFGCYDGNFVLKIQNGNDKGTRVSSAEIRIDGILIAGPSDFSKNVAFISKPLPQLTPESIIEVKLHSAYGSFIDLWIEGTLSLITPTFEHIGPLFLNSIAQSLPATSTNGITGAWSPETISTSNAGNFTYTFTPAAGQCAITSTTIIEVLPNKGVVSDVEGNIYKTIKIGDQWWMAENLKATKYLNGDLIGTTTPATLDIGSENTPKYQWAYDGDEDNVNTYGRLYTHYAVSDNRAVCPVGWHIPSNSEWTTLTDYLTVQGYGYGGDGIDIGKSLAAKSEWLIDATQGNVGNDQPNNNSSGFSALPAGYRAYYGTFELIGKYASWWSSSDLDTTQIWVRFLRYNLPDLMIGVESNKKQGGAVRCVKD
jgi:uncharacterized protein (TIGR02145 family)